MEKIIEKLSKLPEIKDFHYDDRNWDVEDISGELFMPKSRHGVFGKIDLMKEFIGLPYVEDIFGGDDKARYVWMNRLSKTDTGLLYSELRDVNVFCVTKVCVMPFFEGSIVGNYNGSHADFLKGYYERADFLVPDDFEDEDDCKISREKYNVMDFKEKKSYVFEMKENVFGFLSCLADESVGRRGR